jgi:hypothetical protein
VGIRKKLRRLVPYWLRSHEQACVACGAPHAHAVEVRCVACDRAHCSFCVVIVEDDPFCIECQPESERR